MSENKEKKSFLKIINELNDGIQEIFNQIPISIKKRLYSPEMRYTLAILILFINDSSGCIVLATSSGRIFKSLLLS